MGRLMARPSTRRAAACAAAAAIMGLAACTPAPATSQGEQVRGLYLLFISAAAGVFVIVAGLIGWSLIRYRSRGSNEEPVQTHGDRRLEIAWWALPTVLVIGLFIVTAQVMGQIDERTDDPPVTVTVTGFQWQWRFAYQGSDVVLTGEPGQPPELVLPVGERIAFDLESPDVIHSFWVPAFLIKRDVVPGRVNRFEVNIEQPGTYRGQCSEFCGLLHAQMTFSIRAVPADEFQAWLTEQSR
jgi:cytochrome c oxidase subunit 2